METYNKKTISKQILNLAFKVKVMKLYTEL
jgi:hypothetical protein